jgi:hypothetical protein
VERECGRVASQPPPAVIACLDNGLARFQAWLFQISFKHDHGRVTGVSENS